MRLFARLLREIYLAGVRNVAVVGDDAESLKSLTGDGRSLGMNLRYARSFEGGGGSDPDPVIVLLPNVFLDRGAIRLLTKMSPHTIVLSDSDDPVAVVTTQDKLADLLNSKTDNLESLTSLFPNARLVRLSDHRVYYPELRRSFAPLGVRVKSENDLRLIEDGLVARTTKGLHILSELNKYAENAITRVLADAKWVTPNRVTILVNVLAYISITLMFLGHALAAVLLMIGVAILDGVDGKLARLRGVTSNLGKIEHSLDMLFEQVFYVAWIWHVYTLSQSTLTLILGFAFLVSDSFTRHIYMQFRIATGRNLLLMSRVDRMLARVDGRRNVWLIYMLAGILLHAETLALLGMLVHSLATSIAYLVRALTHLRRIDRSGEVGAWMSFLMS